MWKLSKFLSPVETADLVNAKGSKFKAGKVSIENKEIEFKFL